MVFVNNKKKSMSAKKPTGLKQMDFWIKMLVPFVIVAVVTLYSQVTNNSSTLTAVKDKQIAIGERVTQFERKEKVDNQAIVRQMNKMQTNLLYVLRKLDDRVYQNNRLILQIKAQQRGG